MVMILFYRFFHHEVVQKNAAPFDLLIKNGPVAPPFKKPRTVIEAWTATAFSGYSDSKRSQRALAMPRLW